MDTVRRQIHVSANMVTLVRTAQNLLLSRAARMGSPAFRINTALVVRAGVEICVTFQYVFLGATVAKDTVTNLMNVFASLGGEAPHATSVCLIQVAMKHMVPASNPGNVTASQGTQGIYVMMKLDLMKVLAILTPILPQ